MSEACEKIHALYKAQKRQIARSEELADILDRAGQSREAQVLRRGALEYLDLLLQIEGELVRKCGGAVLEFGSHERPSASLRKKSHKGARSSRRRRSRVSRRRSRR